MSDSVWESSGGWMIAWGVPASSYKRVKGRSHAVGKRISMHPHKPHASIPPGSFLHCK